MKDDLTSRSITSVKWNMVSNVVNIVITFVQSVLLARLLPIETFGIVAGAASIIGITGGLSNFGLGSAFTYRSKETQDIEHTAEVHFTLQLVLNLVWTLLMLAGGVLFIKETSDGFRLAYIVLTLSKTALNFTNTAHFLLARKVEHKRLAIVTILDVLLSLVVSVGLAFLNLPLWSLLSGDIVRVFVNVVFLYMWRPVWRPRFKWTTSTVKYFLSFGSKQVLARFLSDALDKVDDLWTKTYLGSTPLGFYSKAYNFAQYPGLVLAGPVQNVAVGTYAEIAYDRQKLSEAFFQTNALLIRTGFYFVGVLFLIAPEFIRFLIGERWLPMLLTFRLMLPFTLFDPMKKTMANLFIAVGKPEIIVKIRVIQLTVMVVGLYLLGNLWGIEGIALAVDIMMVVGIILILIKAKEYVDYSLKKFFLTPFIAMMGGLGLGFLFDQLVSPLLPNVLSALIEIILFSLVFLAIYYILDPGDLKKYYRMLKKQIFKLG